MAEKWIYQVKVDRKPPTGSWASDEDAKIGGWLTVGEEGKEYEAMQKASIYNTKACRTYNFIIAVDVECQRILKEEGPVAFKKRASEKAISELLSDTSNNRVIQWRVETQGAPDRLGEYYDAALEKESKTAFEEEENVEWQINVGGTWKNAIFINPKKTDDESTVIGHLRANGIKLSDISIYESRKIEWKVRGGGGGAPYYFSNPEITREMVEKGIKRNLVRRKVADDPLSSLKQLIQNATRDIMLTRSVKFALRDLNVSGAPYLEIQQDKILFAGKVFKRDDLADLLKGTTGSTGWDNQFHEGTKTLGQRRVVDFKKMIGGEYGEEILLNMKFISSKDLLTVQENIPILFDYLKVGADLQMVRSIPIIGTIGKMAEDAGKTDEQINDIAEGVIGNVPFAPTGFQEGLNWFFTGWSIQSAEAYLEELEKAIREELRNRKIHDDSEDMDYFRMAAGREVDFAAQAWRAYRDLTESRVANVTIGLDESIRIVLGKYYQKHIEDAESDPYWAVMKVNQIFNQESKNKGRSSFPKNETDIPRFYGTQKDVFQELLPGVVSTVEYLNKIKFVPGQGPKYTPEYYEGWEEKPHLPGERYRGPKLFPWEGSEQTYLVPSDGTRLAFASLTPAGGDGVVASPAGGASSLSLPSFPSVSLPSLGGGPSALPSPVGLGGVVGGVPSTPSVGLPGLGWDGAAMPAPSIGLSRSGGVSAPAMPAMGTVSPIGMPGGPAIPSSAPSAPVSAQGGPSGGGGGLDFASLLGGSRQSMIPGSQGFAGTETAEAGQSLSRAEKLVDRLMQIPELLAMAEPQSLGSLGSSGKSAGDVPQRTQPQQLVRMVINRHEEISKEKLEQYVLAWLQSHSRVG